MNPLSVNIHKKQTGAAGEITERCVKAIDGATEKGAKQVKSMQQMGNINLINLENLFEQAADE